jgi:DNA polymerase I-like protein with 3'-5' exonuclease and polymerase domains
VLEDIDTGEQWSCTDACNAPGLFPLKFGLDKLSAAVELWGHNIVTFDLPALKKVVGWQPREGTVIRDTFLLSTLIWTDIEEFDGPLKAAGTLPGVCFGDHGLKAWGYRLGVLKGSFGETTDWACWSPEMQTYCEQDVRVNVSLVKKVIAKEYSEQAIELEHAFADIVAGRMCRTGVAIDEKGAASLLAELLGKAEALKAQAREAFPPKLVTYYTPVKRQRKQKLVEFNPTSRPQIADRLQELGWVPAVRTDKGGITIDDAVLEDAAKQFPIAKPLAELFLVTKRLGYLAFGPSALMNFIGRDGRIHGRVVTNRAVTGRCGHSNPNLGQVPRVGSPYGEQFRKLFRPADGYVFVGADASGLELRCMAHYLAPFDGGTYIKLVTQGDVHTHNQAVFGLPSGKPGRQLAKNAIYCTIYGGGDEKLGETLVGLEGCHEEAAMRVDVPKSVLGRMTKDGRELTDRRVADVKRGMYARERLRRHLTGYAQLVDMVADVVAGPVVEVKASGYKVRDKAKARGFLWGLDGRRLRCRSEHSAMNTLFQSAGALLVKQATVFWDRAVDAEKLDARLVLHVHDEIQAEARPGHAQRVGELFISAIRDAGAHFNFRCPLSGEYKIGDSWAATH